MKVRHKKTAILVVLVLALLLAGFTFFMKPGKEIRLANDFDHGKLAQVIAYAERSNSAYHDAKIFRTEYGPHIEAGEFPISGLRVYVDNNPSAEAQWVVIRGTANMQDIFDDLDFIGREEHVLGINVHTGFDIALQECLPWILPRLDTARPVRVTGHSLGGSVAALLVAVLDLRGFADVSGITFGQPKFTDAHGAAKLGRLNLLRIVHDEDPVPMLPPLDLEGRSFALYCHAGPEVIIKANGDYHFLKEHSATRLNVAAFWQGISHIKPMSHDMVQGYLPALKIALAGIGGAK